MTDLPRPPSPSVRTAEASVWMTRLCALTAGGISLWLTVQKMRGGIDSVAGCGGAGGCSQVLGGRWSAWMGIPVSTIAAVFYAAVFLLTLSPLRRWLKNRAGTALITAACVSLLAAIWFLGVLLVVEKSFCPWCATIHTLGILWAAPVLWRTVRLGGISPAPAVAALAAVAVLIAGQISGPAPETFLLTDSGPAAPPSLAIPIPDAAQTSGPSGVTAVITLDAPLRKPVTVPVARDLLFQDGTLIFRPSELPLLGSPEAPHILVEYFDYTCASCRNMYQDLESAKQALGGKIAVIVLPCPLNRQCNPALPAAIPDHPGACVLARLSLAVWRRAPQEFAAFHRFLMQLPLPADEAAAKTRAVECCGGLSQLEAGLADPWVEGRINETVQEFAMIAAKQTKMPKLLIQGNVMMHGIARNSATLSALLRKQFGL